MRARRALWALGVAAICLCGVPNLRAQGDYLEVYVAKVKPEKAADAEAIARKIADANRRNNGDHVIAMETLYGEGNTYVFVSPRNDYADADKASELFMSSLSKAYGEQGVRKLLADWSSCLVGSRSELRRRRADLSRKVPSDPEAFAKLVGGSRVVRTSVIHVRPGRMSEIEALLKETKERGERNAGTQPLLVSQLVEGGSGATFYLSALRGSLGGFDKNPTLKDIVGEDNYAKLQKLSAEAIESTESAVYRFRPEMSFPPKEIAEVAADFWQPKAAPAAAAKPKAKAAEGAAKAPEKPDAKPQ